MTDNENSGTWLMIKTNRALVLVGLVGLICALVVVNIFFAQSGTDTSIAVMGQSGDYFGGILNPLFSFLTFLAVLATIGMQRKVMKADARHQLETEAAYLHQRDIASNQSFETSFFQLLNVFNQIVDAIDLVSSNKSTIKGRDCFRTFKSRLADQMAQAKSINSDDARELGYMMFYLEAEPEIGHYFRLLYTIIKFVDQSEIPNKNFYTNVVRAQLSANELDLLFYNGLSSYGREKFKPLIEKYALLKQIPRFTLPPQRYVELYSEAAFGGTYPDQIL